MLASPALHASAEPPRRQAPQVTADQTASSSFHLHGTVVDGATGKPIARALVTSADRRIATMTNSEGNFAMEIVTPSYAVGLLAGGQQFRFYLRVQRPGYLQPETQQGVSFSGDSAETRLTLMPAGIIEGHVSAGTSESPRNVAVLLMGHNVVNGDRVWTTLGTQRTNREGAFRFTNLRPGEYTVMSNEWRGDQPLLPARNQVTQQYPPDFFGDAASFLSATRLHLHYGEVATADLHLRLATYYPVTVPVSSAGVSGLIVRVDSANPYSGFALGYNGADHAVEGSLPDGTYSLSLSSFQPQQAFATTVLHVSGSAVRSAPVALSPPTPVIVRLHREFSGDEPGRQADTRVYLQPERQSAPFVTGGNQQGQQDEITLPNAAPGRYRVRVESSFGYAASVRSAGVDLLTELFVVGEGGATAPIDVTLRDDSAKIDGNVQGGDNKLAERTFVCLLPMTPGGSFNTTGANVDGKFTLNNVVPGTYRMFAMTKPPWQFPWHDAETLRLWGGKGVEVVVTPKAELEEDAPLLDATALELP